MRAYKQLSATLTKNIMNTLKKFLKNNSVKKYGINVQYGSPSQMMYTTTTVYPLNEKIIKIIVSPDILYGNYRKGILKGEYFDVLYVGRTGKGKGDKHTLQERLIEHARNHLNENLYFDFNEANTVENAYKKECIDYHHFLGGEPNTHLKNQDHPAMPDGEDIACPLPNCITNKKEH